MDTRLPLGNDNLRAPDSSPWWSFACCKPGTSDGWLGWLGWLSRSEPCEALPRWNGMAKIKIPKICCNSIETNLDILIFSENVWNMLKQIGHVSYSGEVLFMICFGLGQVQQSADGTLRCIWDSSSLHQRFGCQSVANANARQLQHLPLQILHFT